MRTATVHQSAKDEYLGLVKRLALVPIHSEQQYKAAIRMVDELSIIDEDKLSAAQADYLSVLTDLVEKYESQIYRIDLSRLSGLDALRFLLEQNGMNASDLGRLLGNRQLGSAIVRGERQLSKEHIRVLSERFRVGADLFLR